MKKSALIILIFMFCVSVESAYAASPREGVRLTNPLLDYRSFRELRPFRSKVVKLIEQEKEAGLATEIAVYFRSMTNGLSFGIDDRRKFAPASLVKVVMMMNYFKRAERDPSILQEKLKYEVTVKNDLTDVQYPSYAKEGEYYTVDELIRFMAAESDNNVVIILRNHIKADDIDILARIYTELGIAPPSPYDKDYVTLKGYCRLFRVLYNASYLNREMSEKALGYLLKSSYDDGLSSGIPRDIPIANKFGQFISMDMKTRQLHDVGIIYYPGNPYILGVMTKGENFDNLVKVIHDISALVYNEVDTQYKAQDNELPFEFGDEE